MPLPSNFTGRARDYNDGLVHEIRSFLMSEVQAPDVAMYAACLVGVFSIEGYREQGPVTCFFCVVSPGGLDDAVE